MDLRTGHHMCPAARHLSRPTPQRSVRCDASQPSKHSHTSFQARAHSPGPSLAPVAAGSPLATRIIRVHTHNVDTHDVFLTPTFFTSPSPTSSTSPCPPLRATGCAVYQRRRQRTALSVRPCAHSDSPSTANTCREVRRRHSLLRLASHAPRKVPASRFQTDSSSRSASRRRTRVSGCPPDPPPRSPRPPRAQICLACSRSPGPSGHGPARATQAKCRP
jgi:hypothetical protein